MKEKFSRLYLINLLLSVSFLVLATIVLMAYYQVQAVVKASDGIAHTYQVLQVADQILISLGEARKLFRDDLLLGQQANKQAIQNIQITINKQAQSLAQLTQDNPPQHKNVMELATLLNNRFAFWLDSYAKIKAGQKKEVMASLFGKENKAQLSHLLELHKSIDVNEFVLLKIRHNQFQANAKKTSMVMVISGALTAIFLLGTIILLNYQAVRRKVAEQKKNEIEDNLKRIIDSSHDPIAAIDNNYRLTAFNYAYEKKIDKFFNSKISLSEDLREVFPVNNEMRIHWDRALAGETFTAVIQLNTNKNNDNYYYEITFSPIFNAKKNQIGALHIMRDITERRKVENLKNEFVSTVSHELRTPLTSIRGSLGLLVGGAIGKLDGKTLDILNIAHHNCERLVSLINDILDIEKIEQGKIDFRLRPLELNQIVEEAVSANQPYAHKFSVTIQFTKLNEKIKVKADHDRLMQVLTNLISNAIKFSKQDGKVWLNLSLNGQIARVSVIDHGNGVPDEFRKHIFEKFSQADSTAVRKFGGSGLGLSISKAIIEKMHGRIDFTSQEGKGSIFYFELPIWSGNEESRQDQLIARKKAGPKRQVKILYVEDDMDLSEIIVSVLHDKASVVRVSSKQQALTMLDHHTFDLIMLDLILKDESGIDLIPDLKKLNVPIIIFTAHELPEKYKKDVTAVLTKSQTSNEQLVETVMDAVKLRC